MNDVVGEVRRRATAGVRSLVVLNMVSLPLSFATNMFLGRVSADALGYYGAVSVLISTYQTFGVLGGSLVFTRFVPALGRRQRLSFLLSYASVNAAIFTVVALGAPWLAPASLHALLERFGLASASQMAGILAASIPWGLSILFLYATLRPTWAALSEKAVVAGFFLTSTAGAFVWRDVLIRDPGRFLWTAALFIYGVAAALALWLVTRTSEFREAARWRWLLPAGFWPVASYISLTNIVGYVSTTFTPSLVLVWLDVQALGHLHAAMRYVIVLEFVPAAVASVLAPSFSHLEVSGFREQGFGQVVAALRTMLLLMTPVVLGLILFSGDAMAIFGQGFREYGLIAAVVAISALAGPMVHVGTGVAAALNEYRGLMIMSLSFAVLALIATSLLVPLFGLRGAAVAMTASALMRQSAILLLIRRLGFPPVPRIAAAWGCALTALGLAWWLSPSRLVAAGLWLAGVVAFAFLGRVSREELGVTFRRLLGRVS